MVQAHRPTLAEFQRDIGLDGQPAVFDALKALVKKLTRELLPPHKDTSHDENMKGIHEITRRIVELHRDLLPGEANASRRKALRHMISRERTNRKVYYNMMHKETGHKQQETKDIRSSSSEACDVTFKQGAYQKVIDLTMSDSETESMYARESDPGSKDDGSYELKLDSVPDPIILTRSRARRASGSSSSLIRTPGVITIPASISGASSSSARPKAKSGVLAPIPSAAQSTSPPPDEITSFLSRCRPNMEYLLPCFLELGIRSNEDLNSIGKWSADQRRSFFSRMRPEDDRALLTELHLTAIEYQFASRKSLHTLDQSVTPLRAFELNPKRRSNGGAFSEADENGERPTKKKKTALKDRWVREVGPDQYINNENQTVDRDGNPLI